MGTIYKYVMTIGAASYDVHPIYKDDMTLDFEHETQQRFYRGKLSSRMTFVGDDAERIINAAFETEFVLTIMSSTDEGLTWGVFYVSHFYKTDCIINSDDSQVQVKPDVKDRYKAVLDGLDKEYNLIELAPVIESVRMKKRGVLQVYSGGDTVVTNIFGGMSWEQDFDLNGEDPREYHFSRTMNKIEMTLVGAPAGSGLEGRFEGLVDANNTFRLENGEGVYYIRRYRRGINVAFFTDICTINGDVIVYHAEDMELTEVPLEYNFVRQISSDTLPLTLTTSCLKIEVFWRWLCDVSEVTLDGVTTQTYQLGSNDPSYGGNYHYAIGYSYSSEGVIIQSDRTSAAPTEWGRKDQTAYFNTPDDTWHYVPIGRSTWVNYSIWYKAADYDYYVEGQLRKTFYLKDAFPLWSVIQVLLTKLGTGVTFQGTSEYSEFFYGTQNPLSSTYRTKPYITPKSNIIKGEYKDPAMKAPTTLGEILDMVRNAFGCYWYIDEDMKMHIEHISWFKNGGSYTMTHQVGIDLTIIEQVTNGKRWSFGVNEWQYDKEQMPARYQFKWMDECTDVFDYKAYDVVSSFVKEDKVEETNISNFTSDVDYMMVAPENCSKDGFALLMTLNDGENYLPIEMRGTAYHVLVVQNWYASLMVLQDSFLNWDMPSWVYEIDGTRYASKGIQRNKKQQCTIPVGDTMPDLMRLVRTGMGDGEIEKLSLNLTSRMAKTTIKYDTYDAE